MPTEVFQYKPQGVCSQLMQIAIDGDTVEDLQVMGGCHGNLQGIGKLVKGMKIDEVIARLSNIDCRGRGTSCPDQLSIALKLYLEQKSKVTV